MEVVLDEIRVAGRDQRESLRPRIGHVGRGIQPVLEEEKQAEDKTGNLALAEEICREQERHEPLQQRASVESQCWAEPSEEIVAALMHDQIGVVYDEPGAVRVEGVGEKSKVENNPCNQCRPRNWLPRLVHD